MLAFPKIALFPKPSPHFPTQEGQDWRSRRATGKVSQEAVPIIVIALMARVSDLQSPRDFYCFVHGVPWRVEVEARLRVVQMTRICSYSFLGLHRPSKPRLKVLRIDPSQPSGAGKYVCVRAEEAFDLTMHTHSTSLW